MANVLKGGGGGSRSSKGGFLTREISKQMPAATKARNAQTNENMANRWISNYGGQWLNQQMAGAAQAPMPTMPAGGGGGGGGGRGGGYGGYGGGGGDPMAAIRAKLEAALNTQRDAARGALPGYLSEYNSSINQIGKDNQAVTGQYSAQIQALMRQLQAQAQGAVDGMGGDLRAQGAGLGALHSQAQQALLGISNTGTAQDIYNQRLAQMMAAAQADRLSAGASVNQAAQSQLDNAYMQALVQIQGMR